MIEYIYVRAKSTRQIIGIIDEAKSIIWHSTYYGVGDFEVYCTATSEHISLLTEGNYITRDGSEEVGIIEKVETENSPQDGLMIIASGRFAKSILDRRQIYKLSGKTNTPTILSGNVETSIRSLVTNNAINCTFDSKRNISFLELGTLAGIIKVIADESGSPTQKQVSYQNLLDYSEEVLQEYEMASRIVLDGDTYKLQYKVYQGTDRRIDNPDGNSAVIFSQEYDNLSESTYSYDISPQKTAALIGGEGEGLERFYSLVADSNTGLDRRETWVDAASITKTYEDSEGTQHTYTDAEYKAMLDAMGSQEIAALQAEESYQGSINVNIGQWKINEQYFLGDLVTFQDNKLGKYADVRIVEITEVQDESGYSIEPEFETVSIYDHLITESGSILNTETGVRIRT